MKDLVLERTTTAIAAGAVATPVWLPSLKDASEVAGLLLPIAGLIWLIVQIVTKITRK